MSGTETEAKELYDQAMENAGFAEPDDANPTLAQRTHIRESLVAHAKRAIETGSDLLIDPREILAVFGEEAVVETETPDEPEAPEETGTDDEGDDEGTEEPEPTSQPGPPGEPGGPSETPEHPHGA